jgi:hypothetical protein
MPKRTSKTGGELFIAENPLAHWERVRVRAGYLRDWRDLSRGLAGDIWKSAERLRPRVMTP